MDKISKAKREVICKISHEKPMPGGKFVTFVAGQRYFIDHITHPEYFEEVPTSGHDKKGGNKK